MARYPIGQQDFKAIRTEKAVYVDKTQFIIKLLETGKYNFLARPRRFGKSLFLSTLEYFFKGKQYLFKGLAIDSLEWDWKEFPVIHIDLNGGDYTKEEGLFSRLDSCLSQYEKKYEIEEPYHLSLQDRFRNLITEMYSKTGLQVVVLVDEYDKPILDTLDFPEVSESHKNTLRGFYGVLKSLDKCLKLVFLTGVTKFGQMNIFSGLNNIRDISMNPDFGAMCGITEEELATNFEEGITGIAGEYDADYTHALKLLKYNYDGYHFCRNCPDIYNPYSLLNAFADREIQAYWSRTGTPTMLVKFLFEKKYNLEDLDGIEASKERLMGVNNEFDDPVALFYQTGYLSIKSYNKETQKFRMGFPNREVEKAFFEFVLPYYYSKRTYDSESVISNLYDSLLGGKACKAMEYLESFSAGLSYDMIPLPEVERHFQAMMYIVVKLISSTKINVIPELKTSDGRIDLLIETPDFVYIIEIKRNSTPEEALKQIAEKEYAVQYRNATREVFLIGMNFSTRKKRLDGFLIEKLDSNR